MKHCPQCQTSYTDQSLKYCTRDGASLVEEAVDDFPTAVLNEEATVITSRRVEPIHVPVENQPPPIEYRHPQPSPPQYQPPPQQTWQQQTPPPVIQAAPPVIQAAPPVIHTAPPPVVKKSRTGLTVAMTALGMLLLFGLIGAGIYMLGSRKTEVAAVNANSAPAPTRSPNANQTPNQNLNANVAAAAATPTATPTPKPTLDPQAAQAATEDVGGVIDSWADSTDNRDLDAHIGQYADRVDYYKGGRVSAARVRADRQRAFNMYDSMTVNISNVKITPDASGEKATAILDKEWTFEGDEGASSGKVQQQLTFAKIGGKWLITGEKDLKLYRKQSE